MWQAEGTSGLERAGRRISPSQTRRSVSTIPIAFEATSDINDAAGCDDNGAPFVAATEGLMEVIDAICPQTRATDELFGTQTYRHVREAPSRPCSCHKRAEA